MSTILIIEDDHAIKSSIAEMLKLKKYTVTTASNGFEGVLLCEQNEPDLVICDIMMKGMSGIEVLKKIRSNDRIAHTPFIFLTAKSQKEDIRAGMNLGSDDYLTKPFKAQELFDSVASRLKRGAVLQRQMQQKLTMSNALNTSIINGHFLDQVNDISEISDTLFQNVKAMSEEEMEDFKMRINEKAMHLTRKARQLLFVQLFNSSDQSDILGQRKRLVEPYIINEQLYKIADRYQRKTDLYIKNVKSFKTQLSELSVNTILSEIADNAFRYSKAGTMVHVQVYREEEFYVIEFENERIGKTVPVLQNPEWLGQDENLNAGHMGLYLTEKILNEYGGQLRFSIDDPVKNRVRIRIKQA